MSSVTTRCPRKRLCVEATIDSEEDNCPICLDTLKTRDLTTLPCGHTFHAKCIMTNVLQNRSHCPMCRQPFSQPAEDSTEEDSDDVDDYLIVAVASRLRQNLSKKDVCTLLSRFDVRIPWLTSRRKSELCIILAEQMTHETDDED